MAIDFSGLVDKKAPPAKATDDRLLDIPVGKIEPDPENVRRVFDEGKLVELGNTLKVRGQLQPVLVKELGKGKYQLIAGERRWRAAKLAGVKTLKAIIDDRKVEDHKRIDQYIENAQRQDLKPSESIAAICSARSEGLKQVEIVKLTGKSKSTISKLIKLGEKPEWSVLADEIGVRAAYEQVTAEAQDKKGGAQSKSAKKPEQEEEAGEGGVPKSGSEKAAKDTGSSKVKPLVHDSLSIEIEGESYALSRAWVMGDDGVERPVIFS